MTKSEKKVYAILLAGGSGSRMGKDIPKQYIEVNNKPVFAYSLELFSRMEEIAGVQVVADERHRERIGEWISKEKLTGFSEPGKNRQLSICNAAKDLYKLADANDLILIHDSARPLLTEKLVRRMLMALGDHDGVMPVLPMQDTVYYSEDGKCVSNLLDREKIYAGQAPELYYLGRYLKAMEDLGKEELLKIKGTTEVAVKAGLRVALTEGDRNNIKLTTAEDLEWFRNRVSEGLRHE